MKNKSVHTAIYMRFSIVVLLFFVSDFTLLGIAANKFGDTWHHLSYKSLTGIQIELQQSVDLFTTEDFNRKDENWYEIQISQLDAKEDFFVVDLGFNDYAAIYRADSNLTYIGTTGYFVSKSMWPENNEYLSISPKQFIIPNSPGTYYIQSKKISPWANFAPKITSISNWRNERTSFLIERNLTQGLFYGAMLIMFIFNFFIFMIYKDRVYLLYSLYIFSLCLSLLPPFELAYSTFLSQTPNIIKHLELTGDFGFIFFYFGFISAFLSLDKLLPRTYRFIRIYQKLLVVSFTSSQLIFLITSLYYPTQYIYQATSIIAVILVLVVFYQIARRKDTLSKYIITGTLFALLGSGSVLYGVVVKSSFPHQEHYLMEAGHLAELIMFFIGLGVRLRIIEKERNRYKEIDKLKTRLFANITHEFRTPLTLIIAPLEDILKKGGNLSRHTIQLILQNAQRLLQLINQLLDLSKINSGAMSLNPSNIDINKYMRRYVMTFQSLAEIKNIELKFVGNDEPLFMNVDIEKLNKILNNLIFNALKFTNEKGVVTVSITDKGNIISILVTDTGKGISKEKLPFIFDRFFMTDDGIKSQPIEGTGIGLSLTRELVKLHRGTIKVESEEGKGTTVSVMLPKNKSLNGAEPVSDDYTISGLNFSFYEGALKSNVKKSDLRNSYEINDNDKIILLVEDNPDVRKLIGLNLLKEYKLIQAGNGIEGLELAIKYIPDMIVTDLMMPKMDGVELTKKIKNTLETSHIPVIMLTARSYLDDKLTGLEVGADAYLVKPFNFQELNAHIVNLLKQREKLRKLFSKNIKQETPELPAQDQKFIRLTNALIEQNLTDENFDVENLSDQLKISRSGLFRKLKNITGHTPSQYLRIYRLNKATTLLTEQNMTISEIAYEVGFNSVTYFNKSFKEHFKVSPSKYNKA